MADQDSLENCCAGNCTVGSNPTPSAIVSEQWSVISCSGDALLITDHGLLFTGHYLGQ